MQYLESMLEIELQAMFTSNLTHPFILNRGKFTLIYLVSDIFLPFLNYSLFHLHLTKL